MSVPFFVARRYLRPRRLSIIAVVGIVSVIGIVIGTAALIIVMSLFNGLRGLANNLMIGFGPHVQVVPKTGKYFNDTVSALQTLKRKMDNGKSAFGEYSSAFTLHSRLAVQARSRTGIVNAIGIADEHSVVFDGPREATIIGKFKTQTDDGMPAIVISAGAAENLQLYKGDTVTLISPEMIERSLLNMTMPSGVRAVVTGIFQSNTVHDADRASAYADIQTVRRLTGAKGYSTIDVNVEYPLKVASSEQRVANGNQSEPSPFKILTWEDLNAGLVGTMKLERIGSFIVIALIVLVASFNILVSLTLGAVEKRRDIAILLTMGLTPKHIQRIYMIQGLSIGVISVFLGIVIGCAICIGQQQFQWVRFDVSQGFLVPALPVEILFSDVVQITIVGLLLACTAAIYPAWRASKTIIADAVRVE